MCDTRFRLQLLSQKRAFVSRVYAFVLVISFILFMISAFYQFEFMGYMLAPGLSLAMVLGVGMLIFAWGLTFFYVRWANTNADTLHAVLQSNIKGNHNV